jgi:hypothetical protein
VKYRFFVQLRNGELLEWRNLTERQAKAMQALADDHIGWTNVNAFGWEEMK